MGKKYDPSPAAAPGLNTIATRLTGAMSVSSPNSYPPLRWRSAVSNARHPFRECRCRGSVSVMAETVMARALPLLRICTDTSVRVIGTQLCTDKPGAAAGRRYPYLDAHVEIVFLDLVHKAFRQKGAVI